MSFKNTKTPLKPTTKARLQLPRAGEGKTANYYMTPELEAEFRRLFPVTMNRQMMELFGISFDTLQRFKRRLGLTKNMKVIRRKQARLTKRICEQNGYYDSLRGKKPSPQCIEASRQKFASGWHPMKVLKQRNRRKYNKLREQRRTSRLQLWAKEKKRVSWGMPTESKLHVPTCKYTRRDTCFRYFAKREGYILGSIRESDGERYTIFWDADTERSDRLERRLQKAGFTIKELPTN